MIKASFASINRLRKVLIACPLVIVMLFPWLLLPEISCAAPVSNVSLNRIYFNIDGHTVTIPYYRNHALGTPSDSFTRAVIAVHGSDRKALLQYDGMVDSASDPSVDRLNETLILAPHFLAEEDVEQYSLSADVLYWGGWQYGDRSRSTDEHLRPVRVSSYRIMDMIIEYLANSGNFPNLAKIIVAGQSGGGQFVNRYAASSPIEPDIRDTGIEIRYIVANPSSYVYLTNERVVPGTTDSFEVPDDSRCCPDAEGRCTYDDYIYGVGAYLNAYLSNVTPERMREQYPERNVIYLLGRLDNDPCHEALAKSCPARLEGRHRLERGLIYYNYIGYLFGNSVYRKHKLETIPGIAHGSWNVWNSAIGRQYIFDVPATPEPAELISPHDTIEDRTPTYKWYSVPGVVRYRLRVTDTAGDISDMWYYPSQANCRFGGICSVTPSTTIDGGVWRIYTTMPSYDVLVSSEMSFAVDIPGTTTLNSPTGTITDHTPTYEWHAVAGASEYQLLLFNSTGVKYIRWYTALDANCDCGRPTPTCVVTPETVLADGDYSWSVRPVNAVGIGPGSAPSPFTVDTPDPILDGQYSIKVRSSSKCLDFDFRDGRNVQLWDCCGWNNQEWQLTAVGGGYYSIKVERNGKCLDADNYDDWDMRDGGNVQIWECKDPAIRNTDNQEWRIEPIRGIEFRHPTKPTAHPVLDIKVNGSEGPITLHQSDTLTVAVALNNNGKTNGADWWLAVDTSFGLWFYNFYGWWSDEVPAYQGPLFYLDSYEVFSTSVSGLPAGTYVLYFAIDTLVNSNVTWDSLYCDTVVVNITE